MAFFEIMPTNKRNIVHHKTKDKQFLKKQLNGTKEIQEWLRNNSKTDRMSFWKAIAYCKTLPAKTEINKINKKKKVNQHEYTQLCFSIWFHTFLTYQFHILLITMGQITKFRVVYFCMIFVRNN